MTGALPDPGAAFATPCAPPVSRSIRRVRAGLAKAAGRRLRTPLRGVRRVFGRHGAGSGGPQASIPLDAARAREIRGARRKFARIQSPIRSRGGFGRSAGVGSPRRNPRAGDPGCWRETHADTITYPFFGRDSVWVVGRDRFGDQVFLGIAALATRPPLVTCCQTF